ncbi:MAG: hypothetical protein RSF37_12670 [Clostridium sp.]|uniref:hypothetical protein n=1 Tax=Clostridium sp. TaxID=1506 RepID=UPI002FC63847
MERTLELDKNETLLSSLVCHTEVSNSSAVLSFTVSSIISLLAPSSGGGVISTYILSLTTDNIYLESIYYTPIGNLPEVNGVTKIPLSTIETFDVKSLHEDDYIAEHIHFVSNDKEYNFIYNNKKNLFKGRKMKELFDSLR